MKKQNFRRYLSLLLAALMLSTLAGCAPKPKPAPVERSAEELFKLVDEAEQKIRDYAKEAANKYDAELPENIKADPWVCSWTTELKFSRNNGNRLLVTVYRQFDIARAEELLKEYDFVQVIFEEPENPLRKSLIPEEVIENSYAIDMQWVEHDMKDVPSQGFWRCTFTWNNEPFEYSDAMRYWMEVYDEGSGEWYSIDRIGGDVRRGLNMTLTLEPGEHDFIMNTAPWKYDFPPGRYRFIPAIYANNLTPTYEGVFFIGEFEIIEENAT